MPASDQTAGAGVPPGAGGTRSPRVWIDAYLLVLLAWMVARAAHLSITCDEATTLLIHVPSKWWRIFAHIRPIGSNNHLLNTLGIKGVLLVLPEREWVVRLPALLGFVLYAGAARRWVLSGTGGWRALAGIVLLTANPFVLDLLVLARGYALALGLWAWAAVLALEWSERGHRGFLRPAASAALAALSLCANLSFVYPVVALGLLCAGAVLFAGPRGARPGRWRAAVLAGLAWGTATAGIAYVYRPEVLARIQHSLQTWGGRHGVWADSVPSLVSASLWRGADAAWVTAGTAVVAAVLGLASVWAVRDVWRTRRVDRLALACALAWLVIAGMSARHALSGERFPLDRGVLVLIPVYLALLVAAWERAAPRGGAGARVLSVVVGLHLAGEACAYRFGWTHNWGFDAPAREAMRTIAELTRERAEGSVRLAVWRPTWTAIEYYRIRQGVTAVAPTQPDPPAAGYDLYYYLGADAGEVSELGLTLVRHFPSGDTYLARPK